MMMLILEYMDIFSLFVIGAGKWGSVECVCVRAV